MSKFKDYLEKIQQQGYEEMDLQINKKQTLSGVTIPFSYKGRSFEGSSPDELIEQINQIKQLDPKEEQKVRKEIVDQINHWIQNFVGPRNLWGSEEPKKNMAFVPRPR